MPQKLLDKPEYYQKRPEYRNLVRIYGTSVEGFRLLPFGLSSVRGIGRRLAQAIVRVSKMDPNTRIGLLTEEQIAKFEEMMKDPIKFGIPHGWLTDKKISDRVKTSIMWEMNWN